MEISEWRAWELVNGPLGAVRADYHAAQVAAAVYNAAKGKKGRRAKIGDLLFKWDRNARRPVMDPHDMLRTLRNITRQLGGEDRTRPEEVTGVDARGPDNPGRRGRRRR